MAHMGVTPIARLGLTPTAHVELLFANAKRRDLETLPRREQHERLEISL